MRNKAPQAAWALGALAAVGLTVVAARAAEPTRKEKATPAKVDPRADAVLKGMSDFMEKTREFSVTATGEVQVVLEEGQKIDFPFTSEVKVRRPNMIRAERQGAMTDLQLVYDGHQVVLYGKRQNVYASTAAPPTLDATIDKLRDDLGLDLPGADLLYTNAYEGLMQDVVSAIYLGPEMVRGEVCEHVAFHGKEVDFQLWVRKGDTPTPCRYVVTTTTMKGQPQFAVDLSNWDLTPRFDEGTFTFKAPKGAEKIDFLKRSDLKKQLEQQHQKGGER